MSDELKMELDAARSDREILRQNVAQSIGYYMSPDGTKIEVYEDNQLFQPNVTEYIRYDVVREERLKARVESLKEIYKLRDLEQRARDACQHLEHVIYEQEKELRRLRERVKILEGKPVIKPEAPW